MFVQVWQYSFIEHNKAIQLICNFFYSAQLTTIKTRDNRQKSISVFR